MYIALPGVFEFDIGKCIEKVLERVDLKREICGTPLYVKDDAKNGLLRILMID